MTASSAGALGSCFDGRVGSGAVLGVFRVSAIVSAIVVVVVVVAVVNISTNDSSHSINNKPISCLQQSSPRSPYTHAEFQDRGM
jgi:uncharacterized membrane protein